MITDYCDIGEPRHAINVVVFMMIVITVIFLMWKNQFVRVGLEDPNNIKLQIVEREK